LIAIPILHRPAPRQNDDQPLNQQLANRPITLLKSDAQYSQSFGEGQQPKTQLQMGNLSDRRGSDRGGLSEGNFSCSAPTFSNLISTKASLTVAGQRSLRRATHPVKGRKTRNRAPARSDSQSSRGRINNHTHKTRPKIRAAVSAGSPTKPGLKLRNSGTD
jgi:hypothetical protein